MTSTQLTDPDVVSLLATLTKIRCAACETFIESQIVRPCKECGPTRAALKRMRERTQESRRLYADSSDVIAGPPKWRHRWSAVPVGWRGTPMELAKLIGCSKNTIYKYIQIGSSIGLPPGFRVDRTNNKRPMVERFDNIPF